ncbi:TonB-dependent receptor domain-containing protein [Sphingosinicella sp. LY1275]|uniref:TonB-dependent receptor domain-containing protein n=1 Tax=Sphingosinicella sp. LY1275 TaxID=3095379 RepID=UPI002ADEBA15|nr:TonB-dependent receptor [Sphingosinicella sp. LY1275]MEA1014613.1 TonB-dependent receptor [Sphingosinicella sp. LY1275]
MPKPLTLGSLLLLTTALWTPAALAQDVAEQGLPDTGDALAQAQEPADETVDISAPGMDGGEDIVVTGRYIPQPVRATPQVISVLSTEDIARTGDGDIAGALQRVTGLSVVGNGYVYVRGLGDRYSLALLNGLALPSPEPLRRVVPLDIFPTSVLASAVVQKSYSVNYPGEFGGGVINLTTSAIPEDSFLSIGGSISGDTETTGQLGYTYYGSDTDWTGFDDGSRDIPPLLKQAMNSATLINEGATFSRRDIQDMAAGLANASTSLIQRNKNIPANFSGDISGGKSWDIGDSRIGLIASFGYNNSWRTRDAIQQTGGLNTVATDFRSVRSDNRIVVNGLIGLGAEIGEHKLRWTNLYIRDTLKQARLSSGYSLSVGDPDPALPPQLIRQGSAWFERQLINTQFVGEFDFDLVKMDIRAGYANSQRESPYEREFSYAYSTDANDYVNNLTATGQSASISFSDLNEDVYNLGADFSYDLPTPFDASLGFGLAYLNTKRTSSRRDFAFRPANTLNLAVSQQRPDYLLSDYNIYTYDILLVETSALAGAAAYEADLEVFGTYLQLTAEPVDGVRFSGGVRYEDGVQGVTQIDLFNQGGLVQTRPLHKSYFLPAATVTWNFAEDMQLRFNASKTLARPQFRELAPQIYLDIDSDRQFVGNPFLIDSELLNAEARYEWYFGRDQRFSVAGFFKRIDNPIEAVAAFAGGGTLQTTFANAPKADLYGVEVELQKYFPLEGLGGDFFAARRAVAIANYTYSDSKLKVKEGDQTLLNDNRGFRPASEVFGDGDPLTGQSKHIANLQFGLENTDRLSQQTLLVTYASNRVTNRGPVLGSIRQADIVEKPGLRLDFVAREGIELFGAELELKFEARNLLGTKFSEYQQDEIRITNNEYDLGTSFSLGLGLRF